MYSIGYQGAENSNNHIAAELLAKELNLTNVKLKPLISSQRVANALKKNEIDYGVMAHQNSYAGIVRETLDSLDLNTLEQVSTCILAINHAFFVKNESVDPNSIEHIASHEMALKQCCNRINNVFPKAKPIDSGSTSLAAEKLAKGEFDNRTAVICTPKAGLALGLHLLGENMQDVPNNKTEFRIYKRREHFISNYFFRRLLFAAAKNKAVRALLQTVIIAVIFGGLYLKDHLNWSNWDYATNLGPIVVAISLLLNSRNYENKLKSQSLEGYWIYNPASDLNKEDLLQRVIVPRVVKIQKVDSSFELTGYIVDNPKRAFFLSTRVLVNFDSRKGSLVYWYNVKDINAAKYRFSGIAYLEWVLKKDSDIIARMDGRYYGEETKDTGSITYIRISEIEFNNLISSEYLVPPESEITT